MNIEIFYSTIFKHVCLLLILKRGMHEEAEITRNKMGGIAA